LTAIFSAENDNHDKTENTELTGSKYFSVLTRSASNSFHISSVGENNCGFQDERNKKSHPILRVLMVISSVSFSSCRWASTGIGLFELNILPMETYGMYDP
jgi:hypothetical protein